VPVLWVGEKLRRAQRLEEQRTKARQGLQAGQLERPVFQNVVPSDDKFASGRSASKQAPKARSQSARSSSPQPNTPLQMIKSRPPRSHVAVQGQEVLPLVDGGRVTAMARWTAAVRTP